MEGTETKIRHARFEDAEQLCDYLQSIVGESENLLAGPGEAPWTVDGEREVLAKIEEAPNGCLFVARVGGEIVGTAGLKGLTFRRVRHTAELGVTVRRSHWRQGIGRALSQRVIAWAKEMGTLRKIDLRTRADNHGAIALYEQLGFRREGLLRHQWKLDDGYRDMLCMGLVLGEPDPGETRAPDRTRAPRITEATQEHLDGLLELLVQVQTLHRKLDPTRYLVPDRSAFREWLAAALEGETRFLVALDGEDVVGYAAIQTKPFSANPFVTRRGAIHVDQLAVLESRRGRGVGRALLSAIETRAVGAGLGMVTLDTHTGNLGAHVFFDRVGYGPSHERRLKVLGR